MADERLPGQDSPGYRENPSTVIYYDPTKDLFYNLIGGQKQYQSPTAQPSGGKGTGFGKLAPQGGGLVHERGQWNPHTGTFDQGLNIGNLLSLGIGGAIAGPAIAGAIGGGASAAPSIGSALAGGAGTTGSTIPVIGGLAGIAPSGAMAPIAAGAAATGAANVAGSLLPGISNSTLLGVGANLFGNLFGAYKASEGNSEALQAQTQAQREALAFQQQQAAYDAQVAETNRRANYEQYAARQGSLGTVGEMLGLPARSTPAYVPLPANPYGTGGAPTVGQALQAPPPGQAPQGPPNGDYQTFFQNLTGGKPLNQQGLLALAPQLQAAGIQITPPSAAGIQSKIGIPTPNGMQWVRVLDGDTSQANPTVWIPQNTPAAANPPRAAQPSFSAPGAALMANGQPLGGTLQIPRPYYPGSVGDYLA